MTTFTTQDRQDAQRTPLTEEQIINLINKNIDYVSDEDGGMKVVGIMEFARAIERFHGIGEAK